MTAFADSAIADLASADPKRRESAGRRIYGEGRALAERAVIAWWTNEELASLLHAASPTVNVGIAVPPPAFDAIRQANASPRLAEVPPDQDAKEFELHFTGDVTLDILTSKDPSGSGAIARYLSKFGHGVQQVEFRCGNVDRATEILRESFGISAVYPATRPGADGTHINFFLVSDPEGGKVLIELYEAYGTR